MFSVPVEFEKIAKRSIENKLKSLDPSFFQGTLHKSNFKRNQYVNAKSANHQP